MSEELRETVEIIRIGSDYAMQLLGITKEALQAILAVAHSVRMDQSGQVSFKKLMQSCEEKGTSPVPLSFPSENEEILSKAEGLLKDMNVQFARMPDYIQGDNQTQYLVSHELAHFFNAVAKRLYDEELKTVAEKGGQEKMKIKSDSCDILDGNAYMDYVPPAELKKAKKEAIEQIRRESQDVNAHEISEETKKNFFASNRDEQTRNDPDYERISIDKGTLLINKDKDYIHFCIPGTDRNEFVKLRRGDVVHEDGRTLTLAVNRREPISVYDKDGKRKKTYNADGFLRYFSAPNTYNQSGRKNNQRSRQKNNKEKRR